MSNDVIYPTMVIRTQAETIELQEKEIERLKKREQECIDHYLVQCKYASEMESKYISANYVINELEKWLEEQHQFIIEIPAYTKEISIEHKTMGMCYENVLDKLQELKGDGINGTEKL